MEFSYGQFRTPVVQWKDAKLNAVRRCGLWGYTGAEFFDNGVNQLLDIMAMVIAYNGQHPTLFSVQIRKIY